MTRKPQTTKEVVQDQKALAARDLVAAKPANGGALAVGGNAWLEIGAELDKFLGAPLLKFNKQGEFVLSDIDTIEPGTRCIAHCDQMSLGWTKWQDGKPVDRKVGLVADRFVPPQQSALPDRDQATWEIGDDGARRDPWSFQMSVPVSRLDSGEAYCFVAGSKGGLRCLNVLVHLYGKHILDKKAGLPIVELRPGSYKHPRYGKIFYPVMHVVGWTGNDGKPQSLGADMDDEIPNFGGRAA